MTGSRLLTMLGEVTPTPHPGGAGGGPMSMNHFVGGGIAVGNLVGDEDNDYSSNGESEN